MPTTCLEHEVRNLASHNAQQINQASWGPGPMISRHLCNWQSGTVSGMTDRINAGYFMQRVAPHVKRKLERKMEDLLRAQSFVIRYTVKEGSNDSWRAFLLEIEMSSFQAPYPFDFLTDQQEAPVQEVREVLGANDEDAGPDDKHIKYDDEHTGADGLNGQYMFMDNSSGV
ncbi:hypothetical protein BDR05DRAFT_945904 [Suillus weaverae]|nr:hypothetical protein BDR05DRAFT_945904 [Suillus weaverae]